MGETAKYGSYAAIANCEDCGWRLESKNAHGVAAKHHYKTGHTVFVDVYRMHVFTVKGSAYYKRVEETITRREQQFSNRNNQE